MSASVPIAARIPIELRDRVDLIAQHEDRSVSQIVRRALVAHCEALKDEGPASVTGPLVNISPMQAARHEA